MSPKHIARTSAQWAAAITRAWNKAVQSILETGRLLIEAKDKLEYGDFGAMADNLPFGRRTAERLIAIASNSILADATHGSQLPPSWRTLYELSTLPDETLLARLEDGSIRPDLERSSIKAWKQPAKQGENSPSEQPDQPESDEEPEEEEPGITVRRSIQHVTLVDPSTTFRRVTRRVRVQAETQHKSNGLGDGQPIINVASPDPKPEHEPEAEPIVSETLDQPDQQSNGIDEQSALVVGTQPSYVDMLREELAAAKARIEELEAQVHELPALQARVQELTSGETDTVQPIEYFVRATSNYTLDQVLNAITNLCYYIPIIREHLKQADWSYWKDQFRHAITSEPLRVKVQPSKRKRSSAKPGG
jgi:hypothetical protein